MNKSVFEMIWETISSDMGIICAIKAWLWTAVIIMFCSIPIVIKETIRAIAEAIAYKEYIKESKNEKNDMHKR